MCLVLGLVARNSLPRGYRLGWEDQNRDRNRDRDRSRRGDDRDYHRDHRDHRDYRSRDAPRAADDDEEGAIDDDQRFVYEGDRGPYETRDPAGRRDYDHYATGARR